VVANVPLAGSKISAVANAGTAGSGWRLRYIAAPATN
jgi:hypothetical protein